MIDLTEFYNFSLAAGRQFLSKKLTLSKASRIVCRQCKKWPKIFSIVLEHRLLLEKYYAFNFSLEKISTAADTHVEFV
jgi:hypothetical protein